MTVVRLRRALILLLLMAADLHAQGDWIVDTLFSERPPFNKDVSYSPVNWRALLLQCRSVRAYP